jgi:hypothetical protein
MIKSLLAKMWAEYPTSMWAQLKMYRLGALGPGLIKAMKGWINAKTVSTGEMFIKLL